MGMCVWCSRTLEHTDTPSVQVEEAPMSLAYTTFSLLYIIYAYVGLLPRPSPVDV